MFVEQEEVMKIKLSKTEEQLMHHIWHLKKAYMKDIIERYKDPKPANTTLATLLKRIADKGYIGYNVHGRSREYYPLVSKSDYSRVELQTFVKDFFGNSTEQFASFFTRNSDMSEGQLKELRNIIDGELTKKSET